MATMIGETSSVVARRNAKKEEDGLAGDVATKLNLRKAELTTAVDRFIQSAGEIFTEQVNFHRAQEKDLDLELAVLEETLELRERQKGLQKKETELQEREKKLKEERQKMEVREAAMRKREEYVNGFEKKVEEEQKMLALGRHQICMDQKRHQAIMKNILDDVKKQTAIDRQKFTANVKEAVATLQYPTYQELIGDSADANKRLLAEFEELDEEIKKYW